jgi:hypothetical protein
VFIPAALLTEAPDTEGAGFSVERPTDRARAAEAAPAGAGRRQNLTAVGRVPGARPGQPVLDGPVELEAPLGSLGLEPAPALGSSPGGLLGDLEDTESERGGIFRSRGLDTARGGQEKPRGGPDKSRGGPNKPRGRSTADLRSPADRGGADLPQSGGGRKGGPVPLRGTPRTRIADAARVQHQQTPDASENGTASVRPDAPVPLPRRKPSLVAEHGRRVGPHTERPPVTGGADTAPGETAPGALPRRVRQASLAPQLKKEAEASRTAENARPAAEPEPERDAEEVRSRMASLQRGWQRGRRQNEAEQTTADQPETATGTTAEGDGR